ncbi:MAG: hypothetical protein L6Q95_12825 [Planctomycetes bacterium]|nr:hypothetical protein [Planctomycetota bacterium]
MLLLAVAAVAVPEGQDLAEAKEKIQRMLDEAALLEQAGKREEAARVRADAEAMKKRLEGARGPKEGDDPRVQALHNMEKAIAALDKAGYEGMAREMRGMADRLRAEIKGARGQEDKEVDFWRKNLDTLRSARNALLEAQRRDGADALERAIRARELLVEGKPDRAAQARKEGPGDLDIAELLLSSAGFLRTFGEPEEAAQCEELARFMQNQARERQAVDREKAPRGERPDRAGPDDRMARLEERVERMERMLRDTLERLEAREREREHERQRAEDRDRARDAGR